LGRGDHVYRRVCGFLGGVVVGDVKVNSLKSSVRSSWSCCSKDSDTIGEKTVLVILGLPGDVKSTVVSHSGGGDRSFGTRFTKRNASSEELLEPVAGADLVRAALDVGTLRPARVVSPPIAAS